MEAVVYMEDAKKAVAFKDAILRLQKNRDFKKVFAEAYFKDEAARLALALTNYEMQDEIDQRNLDEQIRAIGHVQNWLRTKIQLGEHMENEIEDYEKELEKADQEPVYDDITGDEING